MEPEQTKQEQEVAVEAKQRVWNTVTPLSKYLAMALFVLLPFVGGWIGYQYAYEKVGSKQEDGSINNANQLELSYESQKFTIDLPGEQPKEYTINIPYLELNSGRLSVFSESFISSTYGPTVEKAAPSPSGNYIFFALSNKHDPFVRPYIYHVATQSIHKDCLAGVIADYGYSCRELHGVLGNDDNIEVHWTRDDILTLTVTGGSRQEPLVLRSINSDRPWQTLPIDNDTSNEIIGVETEAENDVIDEGAVADEQSDELILYSCAWRDAFRTYEWQECFGSVESDVVNIERLLELT